VTSPHGAGELVGSFVNAATTYRLSGDELTLTSADIQIRFIDRRIVDLDRRLFGTR
jgi:hypothetical protein